MQDCGMSKLIGKGYMLPYRRYISESVQLKSFHCRLKWNGDRKGNKAYR
ncbi:proline racemase [Microbacter margulisiae]|uniref:Proline racemase n=1 Tax=Microbacter margulisiae TaxID=1350067 RepID=A0A7W5DTW3_9PORP|nr:proline racemase [Microbacter margulisiae]